jgi:hypothetical protein
MNRNRREFLAAVGRGTLAASIGTSLAADLGLGTVHAADKDDTLTFGSLEPLVCLMQETTPAKLLPALVAKLRDGTELKTLVAAAALANARTFGGEDYVGFHTMMALAPAWHMAGELSKDQAALPVLKVLYRNTNRIQEFGGRKKEVLHDNVLPVNVHEPQEQLREYVRAKKTAEAEGVLKVAAKDARKALDAVLCAVEDNTEVHRVVLPYRAWDLLPVIGKEHALTLLRQSVHYCVKSEANNWNRSTAGVRTLLPALLEKHKLLDGKTGTRKADDAWVAEMSETIFKAKAEDAAGTAAQALAEGFEPTALGEAICLAANQLILRDNGRPKGQTASNKPEGSVHGDSIGVHACDSANAWRNLSRASTGRNTVACLILGAFQVAFDRVERGGDFLKWEPYPRAEGREKVKDVGRDDLLKQLEGAIKDKDQARAAALVHRCGELKLPERSVFDLLLRYAISQDGALHAEKYYRTVSEEFAAARPAFKWRQLIGLARVTASEYGYDAPGYKEACELIKG